MKSELRVLLSVLTFYNQCLMVRIGSGFQIDALMELSLVYMSSNLLIFTNYHSCMCV